MKTLIICLFVILLYSCKPSQYIYEDTLYVTRKYCGDLDTTFVQGRYIKVITTTDYFYIDGKVKSNIPKNTRCYLRYVPEHLPGTYHNVWVLYFTYDGTEDLYMLKQNFITGQVY